MAIKLEGFDAPGFRNSVVLPQQPVVQPQKKKGNFLEDILPSLGGIGGGAAGAAIGTAVLPGIGTLAGALLGGALGGGAGQVAKNAETGQGLTSGVGGQALEQGVLSAGPLRLLKGTKAATAAVKGGEDLLSALKAGGTVSQAPGVIDRALHNTAGKMYAQAFTVPKRLAASVQPEKTASELMNYGISGSLDKIGQKSQQILKALGGHFDNAVNGISGQVKVGDLTSIAKNALKNVAVPQTKKGALLGKITDIGINGKLPGYANPSEMLDNIRSLEKDGYDYLNAGEGGSVKNPDTARLGQAYIQVANEMEDRLYSAIGSKGSLKAVQTPEVQKELNGLAKGLGDKFVNAKTPEEVRSLMSPFVRAKNAVKLTEDSNNAAGTQGLASLGSKIGAGGLTGAGIGSLVPGVGTVLGGVGGMLAAPLLRGTEEAVRAPLSTTAARVLTRLAGKTGNAYGAKAVASRVLPIGVAQALADTSATPNQAILSPSATAASQQSGVNTNLPNSMLSSPQIPASLSSASTSPFDPANVESNIAKIVASGGSMDDVAQYVSLVSAINSLQQKAEPPSTLTATQEQQLASNTNAMNTIQQLQQLYGATGGGSGEIKGTIENALAKAGMNDPVKAYNALAESSVSQIAKALNGSGQVSDADAAAIVKALPLTTDSPEVAQTKFAALLQRLQAAQQSTINPSLLSALGAQ